MRFATKLLLLRHHRHRRHLLLLPFPSAAASFSPALSPNPVPPHPIHRPFPSSSSSSSSRSFSWFAWNRPSEPTGANTVAAEDGGNDRSSGTNNSISSTEGFESVPELSPAGGVGGGAWSSSLGQDVGSDGASLGMEGELVGDGAWFYPVHAVISALDGYRDFTGVPWWAIISTSTIALRFTLLPVLILQLRKGQEIASFLPK